MVFIITQPVKHVITNEHRQVTIDNITSRTTDKQDNELRQDGSIPLV